MNLPNDRLQGWLRAEAENADPAIAASQVNALTARALARAKSYPAVRVATAGYVTQQITEKDKPPRWRVAQSLVLESADFTATTILVTKLQQEDGLLISGTAFTLSEQARQTRAAQAGKGLGFPGWRPGHVTVQTSEPRRPFEMRAQAVGAYPAAPVSLEAGTTEVSVTVSGEALLEANASR